MTELAKVISALNAEADEIDRLVADLPLDRWSTPSRTPGWTAGLHLAHLTATFRMIGLAAADPPAFEALTTRLSPDFDAAVRAARSGYLLEPPGGLYTRWGMERAKLVESLRELPDGHLVAWLGTALPPAFLARGAMLQIFGHGQEIADALGATLVRTDRIRHVVAYAIARAGVGFRFELKAPSGEVWEFGRAEAETVRGGAEDFCLLVAGRQEGRDLNLSTDGERARQWLESTMADGAF